MGQDEGDVGPAHAGPNSQEAVHQVHQRPVLWEKQEMLAFVPREPYLIGFRQDLFMRMSFLVILVVPQEAAMNSSVVFSRSG